jgi:hypothetical protein
LALLPFILGALSLMVPGSIGLGAADPRGHDPNEPAQIVTLLNISAIFMGTALTIRDLIGEHAIFRREQSVGLSASAYLIAKIVVYCATSAVQTAILTVIVVSGKGGPTRGALIAADPTFELYVTLAATATVAAITGLALSSAAKSADQILPMLVVSIMMSIVFAGGLIPVTGRVVVDQLSWALPARWGFAATASTVDLRGVAPLTPNEMLWSHTVGQWLLNMIVLAVLGVMTAVFVRWRIRLKAAMRCASSRPRPWYGDVIGRGVRVGRGAGDDSL